MVLTGSRVLPFWSWIILIGLLVGCCGCQNVYEGFRLANQDKCYSLPYPEQNDCLRENDMSYEEYQWVRGDQKEKKQ